MCKTARPAPPPPHEFKPHERPFMPGYAPNAANPRRRRIACFAFSHVLMLTAGLAALAFLAVGAL